MRFFLGIISLSLLSCSGQHVVAFQQPSTYGRINSGRFNQVILNYRDPSTLLEEGSQSPPLFPTTSFLEEADKRLAYQSIEQHNAMQTQQQQSLEGITDANAVASRRMFFAAATIAAGAALGGYDDAAHAMSTMVDSSSTSISADIGNLKWEATPVNKRTGVTVFEYVLLCVCE